MWFTIYEESGGVGVNYTSEIFNRLIIQHTREFLLHGSECFDINNKSYVKIGLKNCIKEAIKRVESGFSDRKKSEAVISEIYNYASVVESVYMEIGMKCGEALAVQFLDRDTVK